MFKITPTRLGFIGLILYTVFLVASFSGYVLAWGQMSFWAVSMLKTVPWIGEPILTWLWGDYSSSTAPSGGRSLWHEITQMTFLPFILVGLVALHVRILHVGTRQWARMTKVDLIALGILSILLLGLLVLEFLAQNMILSGNHIALNPLITPPHIIPEWYMLPPYSLFRAAPEKSMSLLFMAAPLLALIVLPFWPRQSPKRRSAGPITHFLFWLFVTEIGILGFLGTLPAHDTNMLMTQLLTALCLLHVFVILPGLRRYSFDQYSLEATDPSSLN